MKPVTGILFIRDLAGVITRNKNNPSSGTSTHPDGTTAIPGILLRLTEPLENTFAGNLPFPGLEIEDEPVRMIGTDIFRTAPEPLEPDRILAAFLTFHAFRHSDKRFFFLLIRLSMGATPRPWPASRHLPGVPG
jgi:hypothetical protein